MLTRGDRNLLAGDYVGSLWDIDQIQVEHLWLEICWDLKGNSGAALSGKDSEFEAFRLAAAAEVLNTSGLVAFEFSAKADNAIVISIYGGKDVNRSCSDNVFLVEITVWKGQDRRDLRALSAPQMILGWHQPCREPSFKCWTTSFRREQGTVDSIKGK